jgi:GNAT superfamily N-acetyltransferase
VSASRDPDVEAPALVHDGSPARPEPAALFEIRLAAPADLPALEALIASSARGLSRGDYGDAQIERALGTALGLDSQLVRDRTYFAVEAGGALVGCGGWSHRRTLFGGDARAGREAAALDPSRDAARIRAFFVRPDWARRGIGRALLARCEVEARARGFRAAELMATLPGEHLYRACGYTATGRIEHDLGKGVTIPFVPMRKELA